MQRQSLGTTKALLVMCAGVLLVAACSSGGDASDSAPPTSPAPSSSPTPTAAEASLTLVVVGDSIPFNSPDDCPGCTGFVDRYAQAAAEAIGKPVAVENLSDHFAPDDRRPALP
jgi:hypothetical protein